MPPPVIGVGIKRCFCLTSDCLTSSVAYIGPKFRTEKPRKTKIGTEEVHVSRDSDTTLRVKGHQACFSPRRLRTGSCSGQCANVLSVGNCCYVAVCRREALRRPRSVGREGRGVSCRHAHSLLIHDLVQRLSDARAVVLFNSIHC